VLRRIVKSAGRSGLAVVMRRKRGLGPRILSAAVDVSHLTAPADRRVPAQYLAWTARPIRANFVAYGPRRPLPALGRQPLKERRKLAKGCEPASKADQRTASNRDQSVVA
jgi:hypothetical protein